MSIPTILAVIAIVVFVIARQLAGEPIRGRRLIVLPVVLVVLGITEISGAHGPLTGTDAVLLGLGSAVALATGLSLGVMTRLQARDGGLWGQMPVRGLGVWAALIATRVALMAIAHASGAHLAAEGSTMLLTLGLNRIAQAAVVSVRALAAGIPFAPEKDGSVFAAGLFSPSAR